MEKELEVIQCQMMLEKCIDFPKLEIDPKPIAKFIVNNPGKVTFNLLYQEESGKLERDKTIREDLSSLVGYVLGRPTGKTVVILLKTITEQTLKAEGVEGDPTIGDLREIAKKIHPEAKPIDARVANWMWNTAPHYYLLKYLLGTKGVVIPDIDVLSSLEESDADGSPFINWNSSCGYWEYLDNQGGSGRINGCLPVFCYFEIEE